jgi:hypothetical protein
MTQDETPKVVRWLVDRKAAAWNKVMTCKNQLRYAVADWERDRCEKWLKAAQIEYCWLSHWCTLT